MKTTFVVGKSDRRTRLLVILEYVKAPIAGPFSLKAIVVKS
jgi:hypothetical protein